MADIALPQLGETVSEGTILRWFKKVGDTVAATVNVERRRATMRRLKGS